MKGGKVVKLLLFGFAVFLTIILLRTRDMYTIAHLPLPKRDLPSTPAEKRLAADVQSLATDIGPRNYAHPEALSRAEKFMKKALADAGYKVQEQPYTVRPPGMAQAVEMRNFIATAPGISTASPVLIIGAHYDTAFETPGADDNASGCAALLELARRFKGKTGGLELRFVAYSTEEPPFFGTKQMGSVAHARSLRQEGDRSILGMISLEMLGYYSDAESSQKYPFPLGFFYPSRANYIGLVSNMGSSSLLDRVKEGFHPPKGTPVISASLPGWITEIGLSDHKSYWDEHYFGVLITDTSFMRYPHYHLRSDTPEKLDYARLADVVDALENSITVFRKHYIAFKPTTISH